MDGTLRFPNSEAYEQFLNDPTDFSLPSFITLEYVISEVKLSKQPNLRFSEKLIINLEDFEGSSLLHILDSTGVVIIGNYLFSLDFEKKIVGITDDFTFFDKMRIKDFSDNNILTFNFEEDIFDYLDGNSNVPLNGRINLFCNDRKATGDMDKEKFYEYSDNLAGIDYRVKVKHGYQKAGIYFSLMTEIKHMSKDQSAGNLSPWASSNTYLSLDYRYSKYKPRCKNDEFGPINKISVNWDNKINDRPYESSRGLAKYEIRSEYIFEERSASGTGNLVSIKLEDLKDGNSNSNKNFGIWISRHLL